MPPRNKPPAAPQPMSKHPRREVPWSQKLSGVAQKPAHPPRTAVVSISHNFNFTSRSLRRPRLPRRTGAGF